MAGGKLRNFPAARLKEEIELHDGKLFNQAEEQSNRPVIDRVAE